MPFYLHDKESPFVGETPPTCYTVYATRAEAQTAKRPGQTITFQVSSEERDAWIERESDRMYDGTYIRLPWHDYAYNAPECHHYAHLTPDKPGMIAYTPDDEYGVLGKYVTVRPGKYLEEFYPQIEKTLRDSWIGVVKAATAPLQIAYSPDDIERIYASGPRSCMAGPMGGEKSRSWNWDQCSEHPVRAYGDSDFAVVYTGHLDKCLGRAVIRHKEKTFTRVYGDVEKLRAQLALHGYTHGSVYGARLRAIVDRDGYLCPYVDGYARHSVTPDDDGQTRERVRVTFRADSEGQWLVIAQNGDHSAIETNGTTHCDTPNTNTCSHCDNEFESDDEDQTLCPHCEERHFSCADCDGDYYSGRNWIYRRRHSGRYDDVLICNDCYAETSEECQHCRERFYPLDFDGDEQDQRRENRTTQHCYDCARENETCHACGESRPHGSDPCPACDVAQVCAHTARLPNIEEGPF